VAPEVVEEDFGPLGGRGEKGLGEREEVDAGCRAAVHEDYTADWYCALFSWGGRGRGIAGGGGCGREEIIRRLA
jgi:hypothetical protein